MAAQLLGDMRVMVVPDRALPTAPLRQGGGLGLMEERQPPLAQQEDEAEEVYRDPGDRRANSVP